MTTRERNCPILEKAKVDIAQSGIGIERNWIKDICLDCEIEQCFEDTKSKREVKHGR